MPTPILLGVEAGVALALDENTLLLLELEQDLAPTVIAMMTVVRDRSVGVVVRDRSVGVVVRDRSVGVVVREGINIEDTT